MQKVMKIYKEGWINFGRFFAVSFYISILNIPWQIIGFILQRYWDYSDYPLVGIMHSIIFLIIYLPFSIYFAAKLSNQLNTPLRTWYS